MEITAEILVIKETQVISETFSKREFVLNVDENGDGKYPQKVMFELFNDKCDLIDGFSVGQIIKVSFNLRGRDWKNPQGGEIKYFNTLLAWRISLEGATPQGPAPAPYQQPAPVQQVAYHQQAPVQQVAAAPVQQSGIPF